MATTHRHRIEERGFRPRFRPSRRRFLATGLAGAVVLGGAGLLAARPGRARVPDQGGFAFLRPPDRLIMGAIAPVLLEGALPAGEGERELALAEVVAGVDRAFAVLPATTRAEARQLFDLMELAPARVLLAGLWRDWNEAAPDDLDRALRSWRNSRFDLLRTAYLALHEVTVFAWYANPRAWPAMGYDGPPKVSGG